MHRTRLQFRARLPPRALAQIDKSQWIQAPLKLGRAGQRRKDGMRPDSPEPVRRVAGIGLLPVHHGVPIAALRRGRVLRDGWRLLETAEMVVQPAEGVSAGIKHPHYCRFRRHHLFVGSGVIEAGCKTGIGSRLKQSGMFWTVRGANAMISLRCCHLNGRFEDYWEARRAA